MAGKKPSTRPISPPGSVNAHGRLFHRLAEAMVIRLTSPRHLSRAASLEDGLALWKELYERFAGKKLIRLMMSGEVAAAYRLTEALKAFCEQLAALRRRTPGFKTWSDVFLTQEYSARDVRFDVGGGSVFISGRIDAVRFHPQHGLEVVDYKVTHGNNLERDLLQLAIYARLLTRVDPNLSFQGVLEYYEPRLHTTPVSRNDLNALFDDLVVPVLYELVGETPPSVPHAGPVVEEAQPRAGIEDDLSDRIRQCYAHFNLPVEIIGHQAAPQLVRYRVRPAAGVKVVSLANRAEDLQVALSLKSPPLIEPAQGCVTIDVPKEKPDVALWRELIRRPDYVRHSGAMVFPIGVGVENHVLTADLTDPNHCHLLVAGATGSGKSEFLKSMVASLIARNRPDQASNPLQLTLIDPKILTFSALSDSPRLARPIITDPQGAIACLENAVADMEARYRALSREGFENLAARHEAGRRDMPFSVIVFDEFADLILAGRDEKKTFETLVARLAAKGRACGIHLVLATQRPDRTIVTGLIKANLPLKVCLRVSTAVNSQIILGQGGAETLVGRGDLLCDRGRKIERAQAPFISQEELQAVAGVRRSL